MTPNKLTLDTKFMNVKDIYDSLLCEDKLNLHPEYQRETTWNEDQNNLFIDSLINGYVSPQIVIVRCDNPNNEIRYECLDGQHRMMILKKFMENEMTYKTRKNMRCFNHFYYQNKTGDNDAKLSLNYLSDRDRQNLNDSIIPVIKITNEISYKIRRDIFCRLQNGTKVSSFGKLRNHEHPITNFIRDNSILNNPKIISLSKILFFPIRLNDEESHETKGKLSEKKQKVIFNILVRMIFLFVNQESEEIEDFTLGHTNTDAKINNHIINNSKNLLIKNETLIDFYAKLRTFLTYLNYSGNIKHKELMILLLWKYYLDYNDDTHKFSIVSIINKYNNEPELTKTTPDNDVINNIYDDLYTTLSSEQDSPKQNSIKLYNQ